MEAPDKIYFDESDVRGVLDTYQYKFPHDIFEYVRKDAFIEKVCNWLLNNLKNYSTNTLGAEYLIEDFKNYMKEE